MLKVNASERPSVDDILQSVAQLEGPARDEV